MIYGRVVKRLIISREKSRGIEDVSLRGTRHRLRVVSQSSFCLWFGNRSIRETIERFRAFDVSFFFFFFWNEDFSILGDSFKRETVGVEAKRGETGNNEKMMALFKGMNVRRDFIAGNERILGGARLRDTLTGNSSGFYEYGVTVPLIITV